MDPTFSRLLPGTDIANGVLNAGLRIVGSAAAVYNLATGNVKNALPDAITVKKA